MSNLGAWAFPSSGGSTTYEVILNLDGTLTCSCPGWIIQRKAQPRGCKHTKIIAPFVPRILTGAIRPESIFSGGAVYAQPRPSASTKDAPAQVRINRLGRAISFDD